MKETKRRPLEWTEGNTLGWRDWLEVGIGFEDGKVWKAWKVGLDWTRRCTCTAESISCHLRLLTRLKLVPG